MDLSLGLLAFKYPLHCLIVQFCYLLLLLVNLYLNLISFFICRLLELDQQVMYLRVGHLLFLVGLGTVPGLVVQSYLVSGNGGLDLSKLQVDRVEFLEVVR